VNAVEIAWVAGIFEGEGTINFPRGDGYPSIRIAMTDEDVVRRLREVTGVGTIITRTKLAKAHHKQQWQWNVCARRDVARVLCAIAPLLGKRRRDRTAEAAERLSRLPRSGPSPTTPCGTHGGAQRHYRHGEKPCEACRLALNEYQQARLAARGAAK
jgi:hypothetical protein